MPNGVGRSKRDTPCSAQPRTMAVASDQGRSANGFSHSTCMPASAAASVRSQCVTLAEQMLTASTSSARKTSAWLAWMRTESPALSLGQDLLGLRAKFRVGFRDRNQLDARAGQAWLGGRSTDGRARNSRRLCGWARSYGHRRLGIAGVNERVVGGVGIGQHGIQFSRRTRADRCDRDRQQTEL